MFDTKNSQTTNVHEFSMGRVTWIDSDDQEFEWLFDRMWRLANRSNKDWFNLNINTLKSIQVSEYDAAADDAEYKEHIDTFWTAEQHRKLSCTVQRPDPGDYEGEELSSFFHLLWSMLCVLY